MIDGRVKTITSHLKRYDSDLFADRNNDGFINIMRNHKVYDHFKYQDKNLFVSAIRPQFVTVLTSDWTHNTDPVEWGIEPLLHKIKQMDQWTKKENALEEIRRHNEQVDKNKERALRNEVRARAADLRRDFALATSDINTSTVEKIDHRRIKDGYRK